MAIVLNQIDLDQGDSGKVHDVVGLYCDKVLSNFLTYKHTIMVFSKTLSWLK